MPRHLRVQFPEAMERQRLGWQEDDLLKRRRNDPAKLELAGRLRFRLKPIAARVPLGSSKSAKATPVNHVTPSQTHEPTRNPSRAH